MDLEGKVHRAAAERGAVELKKNEFQGELEKQRQQIDKIQALHSFQMENVNRVHQEEKVGPVLATVFCESVIYQDTLQQIKIAQTFKVMDIQSVVVWQNV